MSRVVLEGLEFHARHGVYDTEAVLGARFVVDVELHYSFADIGDDLSEAVNYAVVYAAVKEEVTQQRHQLIEVLAASIARRLLRDEPRLRRVLVRVHKPFAPLPGVFRDVYAELNLEQEEAS
ncbi:dihydroneopterin aldolase [Deinococcus deserti]|uniref:7,8-dihydroneopterin aldolase n=1 Tax=Deinococcus deserti (strain DSM 17065 / CIP 109153 / LMG 22923 / VCD115) TaxID=546414 RepID=C1CZ86_DEIDV|nr:dihydroneopterin aldolase [Deinococcus deserti]ACO45124.1 putative dihydroneopterin aldolase (DHNA) [Deinococcus deserti VCD115]